MCCKKDKTSSKKECIKLKQQVIYLGFKTEKKYGISDWKIRGGVGTS